MYSKRVLFVSDDMAPDKELFEGLYRRRGIEAVIVLSMKEALKIIKQGKFDLIVTDMSLPEGEKAGIDLIKQIRAVDKTTKIFVATGYGEQYKEQALWAGANDYFEKPYDECERILKPLGVDVGEKPVEAVKKPQVKTGMEHTLHNALHEFNTDNSFILAVPDVVKSDLSVLIEDGLVSGAAKEVVSGAIKDLDKLLARASKIKTSFQKIQAVIYKEINTDEVMME
jgi:DNA-binding NtrC family response regulator